MQIYAKHFLVLFSSLIFLNANAMFEKKEKNSCFGSFCNAFSSMLCCNSSFSTILEPTVFAQNQIFVANFENYQMQARNLHSEFSFVFLDVRTHRSQSNFFRFSNCPHYIKFNNIPSLIQLKLLNAFEAYILEEYKNNRMDKNSFATILHAIFNIKAKYSISNINVYEIQTYLKDIKDCNDDDSTYHHNEAYCAIFAQFPLHKGGHSVFAYIEIICEEQSNQLRLNYCPMMHENARIDLLKKLRIKICNKLQTEPSHFLELANNLIIHEIEAIYDEF